MNTSTIQAPVTPNPVKTSLTDSTAMSAPPDHHGKENTIANLDTAPVGSGRNAKKRKADLKSAKAKAKRSKVMEDPKMVDGHTERETETPAPTRSGRRTNLPSRLKDGYAPPKRNTRKKSD
jgi:hypothetical protein